MKDKRGLYFYPFPGNRQTRTYVRESGGDILFRLWSADDPDLWKEHGWVPYEAIKQAAGMFKRGGFDPDQAYDIQVAKALIEENRQGDEQ